MASAVQARQWLFFGAALLILGSVIAYNQFQDHWRIGVEEHERLSALADIVGENAEPQIVLADRIIANILKALPSWQAENDGFKLANRELRIINDTINGIPPLLVMNASGTVVVSSDPKLLGMNFAYREYFKTAVTNPDPTILQVSAPFKTVLNDFAFTLLRTIKGPNGDFAGIVVVTEVPAYFTNLLDSVRYAPDVRITIIHGDGKTFLSSPSAGLDGMDMAKPGGFFSHHRESGRPTSAFTGAASTGEERMMALRTVQLSIPHMDKTMVVAVSRDLQSVFVAWRKSAYVQGGLFGVLVLATGLGLYFYQKRQQAYRRAEIARHASEEQLASFYALDLVGLTITSPEKGWIRINECLCKMLEYSEQELREMTWAQLTHPDDLTADVEQFNKMLANEIDGYSFEKRFISRTGTIIPTKLVVRCLRKQNGDVDYVMAMVEDITERKRAEEALRKSEQHYRGLFNNAVIAILRTRPDGSAILDCNDKFLEITGMTREEVIGSPSAIIWEDPRQRDEMVRKLYAEGSVTDIEFRMLNKQGEARHCISSLRLFREENVLEGSIQDITERKVAADKIEHLAFYDPLTDLPNRRLLLDRLQQALTSSTRHHRYGALMLLDMDDFKTLNDTLGHDVGDKFLVEVANRLQACVREGDTVARHGGDEFVVILEDLNEDTLAAMQAESVAVKILRAVSQPYLLDLSTRAGIQNTRSYHCTSSIGITLFQDHSVSVDELLKRADTAMYKAKAEGGNLLRFFDPEMQAVVTTRAALDNDLRVAVRENQFLLYYQPQVDGAGRMTGAEALVRWQHPQRGMVFPGEFIPQAELTGLILPIGNWVLKTACAQLAVWSAFPQMSHLTLAVNVSARQFRHPDFVDQVLSIIDSTGANAKKLKLELTESLLLDDVEEIIAKMTALKTKNVGFSLDDFGTGYSSLSYLKRLPLDQLKIDQSFVRDVLIDPNDAAIARTIVALAQSMSLAVIAEGVETEAQREFLAANGCSAYQGYLFGRPMPIEDFSLMFQMTVTETSRSNGPDPRTTGRQP